jgi:phosphoenolpyruvate-protein kinase (PTS system EI component)
MVSTVEELRRATALLDVVRRDLESESGVRARVEVGAMIEVPSAALVAESLVSEVDFLSLGTNDLAQYTLAADRDNARTSALADELHPAVLHLIRHTVEAAHAQGKWVSLCGELASDVLAVPMLLGLGLDQLSVSPVFVPEVKAVIRKVELSQSQLLAEAAVQLDGAAQVRALLRDQLGRWRS